MMERKRTGCQRWQPSLVKVISSAVVLSLVFSEVSALTSKRRRFALFRSIASETKGRAEGHPALTVPHVARYDYNFSETNTLALIDGEGDAVQMCEIALPPPLTLDDVEFEQSSTNLDVYEPIGNENLLITTLDDGRRLNVTITNYFSGMTGETEYEFVCRLKSNGTVLYAGKVDYRVSGMVFYHRYPDGSIQKISGQQGQWEIPYTEALKPSVWNDYNIGVFIQYPDGSTSHDFPSGPFPKQESLSIRLPTYAGQLEHDEMRCDTSKMGSYSNATGLVLPDGCGYGFYRDNAGELYFGMRYVPYKSGYIVFDYEWPALVESFPGLAEEGYQEKLDVHITGQPPVVVTDIGPKNTLFRKEGGQRLEVQFYNGGLRPFHSREFVLDNGTVIFKELPGSYRSEGAPSYLETAYYIIEPGSGSDLPYQLQYYDPEASPPVREDAVFLDGILFSMEYDTRDLELTSISPDVALETGGTTMVVEGYFPGFDPRFDGVYFNDKLLENIVYTSVSDTRIEFVLPPRSQVGDGFDFDLDVRVGYARSPTINFKYVLTFASVRITQSGTTQISGDGVYRLGDCTPGVMTAIVSPFTSQVESYEWSLTSPESIRSGEELLGNLTNPSVNRTAQTIGIVPDHLELGETYLLHVKVTMLGAIAETSVLLIRENSIVIGSYILQPPVRSIAYPETPLRLAAVVEIPGECYNGTQGLIFEWQGFGKTQRYSPKDATGLPFETEELEPAPARLGREFIVPQSSLSVGQYEVLFKTWMEESPFVSGSARAIVEITHSPLQAIIRNGESRVTVNINTNLAMTGNNSRDPDLVAANAVGDASTGLIYEWSCLQTVGDTNFENEGSISSCEAGLLPAGTQARDFVISKDLFASLAGTTTALKYGLVVKKEGRASAPTSIIVEIDGRAKDAYLMDYYIEIQDGDGEVQDPLDVKYYKSLVLDVSTPHEDMSWTYEVVEPEINDVMTPSNLIQTAAYYSPDESGIGGSRKPLGISPLKLAPFTEYTIKVSFSGSATFEDTSVFVTFRTSEQPALNFPEPTIMNGTTLTQYVATAGIPGDDSEMSYYYYMEDSEGRQLCVGGCTGYSVAYFRIGRPGNYTLSVLLYDSQGKALLAAKTLERPIVVSASEEKHDIVAELETLFANGDDASWTQLAYDYTITMEGFNSTELAESEAALSMISDGLRKIMCDSRPSTGHSQLAIDVATHISSLEGVTEDIVYDLAGTVDCSIANTPGGTTTTFSATQLVENVEGFVEIERLLALGSGRRRLLQTATGQPFNLRADMITWSSRTVVSSELSSKQVGYVSAARTGHTVALVTDSIQLPTFRSGTESDGAGESGELRYGLETAGGQMRFYSKDGCADAMFPADGRTRREKRYVSVRSVPNFADADGFQDGPPPGDYLSDRMLLVEVFEQSSAGRLTEVGVGVAADVSPCHCSVLPVTREQDVLSNNLGATPGAFVLTALKPYGTAANASGQYFGYEMDGSMTMDYVVGAADGAAANETVDGSVSASWVEVCTRGVGYIGPTIRVGEAQSATGSSATLIGVGGVGLVGMVLAGLMFVVVAVVASWVIATRSMSAGEAPPAALEAHELYVERDIYGRETIFDKGAGGASAAAGGSMDMDD